MRSLKRNQQRIFYSNLLETQKAKDEYGHFTGENIPVYDEKKPLDIYVSANTGDISTEMFGNLSDYDRVMSISDTNCPINENSLLWIGISAEKPHNFIVKRKAESLNETVYAIQQVTVNEDH
jgi:hypothetical protein